jgi:lipopolysaccharide biosynthesis glycosyltransferase|tara:strand:- start:1438 stop:3144 length:1707 start_codon:yes stop_codon:yes gene_type:complete
LNANELKIFVGWDSREDIAYQVCKQSLTSTASVDIKIIPLKQKQLKLDDLYWRDKDKLASTEFTFTRFLIPELMNFKGWALFIDCDFVALEDVKKLFAQADDRYAIMCAHHDYTPKEGFKMDGKAQLAYPRKNWSSMMLFNCGHPSNKKLTKELINDPETTGKYLHRFSWLNDSEIGQLSHEWNWLVGWYKEPKDGKPKFLHYTEGGPWFDAYADCEYANQYYKVERKYLLAAEHSKQKKLSEEKSRPKLVNELTLPDHIKEPIKALAYSSLDPNGQYYGYSEETAMAIIQNKFQQGKIGKVAAIYNDDLNYDNKPYVYDEYLEALSVGIGGRLSTWKDEASTTCPLIIRGVGKSSKDAVLHCWETGRDFYAIDTGYFGNSKSKSKGWHRITKNNLQNLGPIIERPHDRMLSWKYKKFRPGKKILICPPSAKVMKLFDQPTPEEWTASVVKQLRQLTDRPIEVRMKPTRTQRIIQEQSLEAALDNDVHCLITYNSIAALESLMVGKPAITLGPNCASLVCNTKLADVENLHIPDKDEMVALMAHLSYAQFSRVEMMNGFAWDTINEGS